MNEIASVPLCVDLDDTLIKSDLLFETILLLGKQSPAYIFALPFWILKGRGFLKRQVVLRVRLEIAKLPFRRELIDFLRMQKKSGRRLVLVTAADQGIADEINAHLQLFDEAIGSHETRNIKGTTKAELLKDRYGVRGFDYIADSRSDFAVWRVARRALIVSDSPRFINAVAAVLPVEKIFSKSDRPVNSLLCALRVHQWSKNLLIFIPIITAHRIFDVPIVLRGFLACVAFSFFSSAVYLFNDLIDLESDRAHLTKRHRAVAAGELSIFGASALCVALLAAGAGVGWFCGPAFLLLAAIYVVSNVAYSAWLKRVVMLDVVVLACFYTLRLLAGGAATGIGCSDWLLAFSVFFFFCLAMVKRYSELRGLVDLAHEAPGRGYFRTDLEAIGTFGVGSGLISVLVLVLYVMSPEVRLLYAQPRLLLLLCPLFLYWITRLWFKAHRGEVPEDPVVFATTDRTSYFAGILAALVLYAATV
jgi:4-hydroxybenzoate polyprenyltransferase